MIQLFVEQLLKIVQMIRDAGAKEVHMLIAICRQQLPLFYGVDTPNKENLIASYMNIEEIRENDWR